jgi:hypothetical protein
MCSGHIPIENHKPKKQRRTTASRAGDFDFLSSKCRLSHSLLNPKPRNLREPPLLRAKDISDLLWKCTIFTLAKNSCQSDANMYNFKYRIKFRAIFLLNA